MTFLILFLLNNTKERGISHTLLSAFLIQSLSINCKCTFLSIIALALLVAPLISDQETSRLGHPSQFGGRCPVRLPISAKTYLRFGRLAPRGGGKHAESQLIILSRGALRRFIGRHKYSTLSQPYQEAKSLRRLTRFIPPLFFYSNSFH